MVTEATGAVAGAIQERTNDRRAIYLVDAEISTRGPLVPGRAIPVTVGVSSKIPANLELRLQVLDIAGEPRGVRTVDEWRGRSAPARTDRVSHVQFAEPGYYRVLATLFTRDEVPDSLRGRDVVTSASRTLWLLVDESGGRVTDGYDESIARERNLAFGAYGPFLVADPSSQGTNAPLSVSSSINVFGVYKYFDQSVSPVYVNDYVPVNGGRISASCIGRSSPFLIAPDIDYPIVGYVGPNGAWSLTCPAGVADSWDYITGSIYPDGVYADVRNHNNASNASGFLGYDNDQLTIYATSNYQAHVLTTLEKYVPLASGAFSRSRSKINVRVHDTETTSGIFYSTAGDFIRTHYGRIFNTDGVFVTLHEFGHAFHWKAIEPPANYSCTDGEHSFGEVENISCAFVEGFADFFAAIVGGDYFTSGHPGTDWDSENHVYDTPSSNDGWRREGAVAGFLYDLGDTPTSPNSLTNTSDGIDDDSASYALSSIAGVMESCSVNGSDRIDGIDQFIYCAEDSLDAQNLIHPATSIYYFQHRRNSVVYSTVSVGAHSMSASVVRTEWLRNLFGQ